MIIPPTYCRHWIVFPAVERMTWLKVLNKSKAKGRRRQVSAASNQNIASCRSSKYDKREKSTSHQALSWIMQLCSCSEVVACSARARGEVIGQMRRLVSMSSWFHFPSTLILSCWTMSFLHFKVIPFTFFTRRSYFYLYVFFSLDAKLKKDGINVLSFAIKWYRAQSKEVPVNSMVLNQPALS